MDWLQIAHEPPIDRKRVSVQLSSWLYLWHNREAL